MQVCYQQYDMKGDAANIYPFDLSDYAIYILLLIKICKSRMRTPTKVHLNPVIKNNRILGI